ncbi:MAG TPA: hypothetical protein VFA33_16600 [Bryobacteraceae bacterium]|nr:hypothetical protein [Bryobacteraceae bacterium]
MNKVLILIAAAALSWPLAAQPGRLGGCCCTGANSQKSGASAPLASSPVVDVKGTIAQVHIAPGQGMPYLEVKTGPDSTKVYLGSMRYLIAENFNPKAGQEVTVKGYKLNDAVIAIQVTLPAENRTLKLRDEQGRPLWRGRFGRPCR